MPTGIQPRQITPNTPFFIWPTPDKRDLIIWEERSATLESNKVWQYGDRHPNQKFPNHVLIHVTAEDGNKNFRWYWMSQRTDEDQWNWKFSKADLGGKKFDSVERTYVVLREKFDADVPAIGSLMPDAPEGKFIGSYVLADRIEQPGDKEIDGLFVVEKRVYIKRVVMSQNDYDATFGGNLRSTQTLYYTGEAANYTTAQRAGSSVTGTVTASAAAYQDFTFTGQPAEGNTITVNSEVWTFKELSKVLTIGSIDACVASVIARFNAMASPDVTLSDSGGGAILATATVTGAAGNAITVGGTMTGANAWSGAGTLTGGGTVAAVAASLQLTIGASGSNVVEGDSIIVDENASAGTYQMHLFDWKTAPSGDYEAAIGATMSDSVDNMVTKINTTLSGSFTALKVTASSVVYMKMTCDAGGSAGNNHAFRTILHTYTMTGWNLSGGADAYEAAATATLTIAETPTAADTVDINGEIKTWQDAVLGTWVDIGETVAGTIASLLATAETDVPDGYTFSQIAPLVVRATFGTVGTAGNAIGTTKTGTFGSWADTTMNGGAASASASMTVTVVTGDGTVVSVTDTLDGDSAAAATDRARQALSTAMGVNYDVYGNGGEIWVEKRGTPAYTNDADLDVTITLGAGSSLTVVPLSATTGGTTASTIDALFADDDSSFWGLQKTGIARTGEQLTASWFVVTEKQVIPAFMLTTGRSYDDTIDSITLPAVFDRMLTNIWPRKDGGSQTLVFPKYLRNAYGGPLRAEISETFHVYPVTPDETESMQPTAMDIGSPIGSVHVPACLHGDVQCDQSTGTAHPVYRYTTASFFFAKTNFTDWPKTYVASSSINPLRGGYLKRNLTIHRPSDADLSPPT
jgi:hypothetical protein